MELHQTEDQGPRADQSAATRAFDGSLRRRRALRPVRLRLACGILAAALLGTLAMGTWRAAGAIYREPWPAGVGMLHMPTLPPPPFPIAEGPDGTVEARVRLLLHVVVVPQSFGLEPRPRLVREFDVEWPRDRGRELECVIETSLCAMTWRLEAADLGLHLRARWRERDELFLRLDGSQETQPSGGWSRGTGSGISVVWNDPAESLANVNGRIEVNWGVTLGRSLYSLAPRRLPSHFKLGVLAWRVELEDPLTTRGGATALPRELPYDRHGGGRSSSRGGDPRLSPGAVSYLGHVRLGLLPLFASVCLLTQLFRRRDLAFLALLAAAVLLGVAADRYTVGVHLGRLTDAAAPLEERGLALDALETTFFYRQSALAAARRIAADEEEPEVLRAKAASAVQRLDRR